MTGATSELGDVEAWAAAASAPVTEREAADWMTRLAKLRDVLGVLQDDCTEVVLYGDERKEDARRD